VRFALSAAAAASGLLLLGVAVFGQPESYLRLAREQWDSLTDTAAPEPDQVPTPTINASLAQLQQQVLQLRDEIAARRDEAEQARQALAAAQAQREAAERQARQEAAERQAAEQPTAAPPAPPERSSIPAPERQDSVNPPPTVVVVPEHQAVPAIERRDPLALPDRHAAAKPATSAPRPPPRQEADNAQSVLARLRQAAPTVVSAPDAPPPVERVARGPSPSLRRLIAARAALASGQIEDTRRLLQEAQLQLVFRPVGSAEDDPIPAGRAASDVAHALDALSGNDIALSRSYIDRAVDDASGHATDSAVREQAPVTPGYAPAYPLR
jgi:DNA primase